MPLNIGGNIISAASIANTITTNGITIHVDAANKNSYPGSGNTWTDLSGYGNNGTLSGSASFDTSNGGCIAFNGSSSIVSFGNFGSMYSEGSVDLWINPTVMANYNNCFTTNYQGGNAGIRFEETTVGGFSVAIGNDAGTITSGIPYINSGMSINTWYNAVLTWSVTLNYATAYLNGIQILNVPNTSWATTMPGVTLGIGWNSRYWNGKIAILKFYNRRLYSGEVSGNFNAVRGRFGL